MEQQGKGTYVDVDGVTKSAVDPGDVVQLPYEKPDKTNPIKVLRFENKIEELNDQLNNKVEELKEVTKDYEHYRKGPQGASPDPRTGEKIGYGINAFFKEMKRNELKNDTGVINEEIRAYEDSLKSEEQK